MGYAPQEAAARAGDDTDTITNRTAEARARGLSGDADSRNKRAFDEALEIARKVSMTEGMKRIAKRIKMEEDRE